MNERFVYLNGTLIPQTEARVSVLDRGFLFGDGVFETLRVYNATPFALDRHLARLYRSLKSLNIEIPEDGDQLAEACRSLLNANGLADTVLRITVTRGVVDGPLGLPKTTEPTRLIAARDLVLPEQSAYQQGVIAGLAKTEFGKAPSLWGVKSLNYLDNLSAKQEALDNQWFEALMQNRDGDLVEGSSSNLFAVVDNQVSTPSLSQGALPGITREICMEILERENLRVRETRICAQRLETAKELFLTNSVMEIVPVVRVGNVSIGTGIPGPVYRRLIEKYRELVGDQTDKPRR